MDTNAISTIGLDDWRAHLIPELRAAARRFFALPTEAKARIRPRSPAGVGSPGSGGQRIFRGHANAARSERGIRVGGGQSPATPTSMPAGPMLRSTPKH